MAGAKEIRNQIKSIGNTRKITKAMEMVAASKMRRAQERMHKARPYAARIRDVVAHAASANTEYHHPYLEARDEIRHAGYIVVSSDRGLCGGLNSNLFRKVVADMGEKSGQGVEISVCVIGKKASAFFKRHGANVVSEVTDLGDSPHVEKLIGALKVMMDGYIGGDIDRLFVVYNDFVNTMIQRPTIEQLIPIIPSRDEETQHHWDYIYEPEAKPVVDTLMDRYIESLVYQAVADNNACEQAARMVAMKAATDNAGKLIDELRLVYNKARQAAITQELSEIVGGAAAV